MDMQSTLLNLNTFIQYQENHDAKNAGYHQRLADVHSWLNSLELARPNNFQNRVILPCRCMLAADPKKHPSAMSIVADLCEEARTEHLTQGVPNPDSFQRLNGRMRSEDPPFIQDHSNA